jgi:hypothetical protein
MRYFKFLFGIVFVLFCLPLIAEDEYSDQVNLEIQEEVRILKEFRNLPLPPPLSSDLEKPIHVMFTFVDHWEPGLNIGAQNRANLWYYDYPKMASKHTDADGKHPQHDWFCLYLEKGPLQTISKSVFEGFGEMNPHIHHGTINDDYNDNTSEMEGLVDQYISYLNTVGACITAEEQPTKPFAFVHGMWSLDNSRDLDGHRQYCGCNREIDLLLSKNCYADFTFPAWGSMQPTIMIYKIFAARDCNYPKSYDLWPNIRQLIANSPLASDELTIFEGPWNSTNIDRNEIPTLSRMTAWINYNVSVPGKPNWIFVKTYTHSAANIDYPVGYSCIMGDIADQFYTDIERVYNDGVNYQIHYCTAREAYNIAMAAVDGVAQGSPSAYRDYNIPPPANRFYYCSAFYILLRRDVARGETVIQIMQPLPSSLEIWSKDFDPDLRIYEKNSLTENYSASDAETTLTLTIPVLITDRTPSVYYIFSKNDELSCVKEWDMFRYD